MLFALTLTESASVTDVFVIFAFKLFVKTDTSAFTGTAAPTPFIATVDVELSISEVCVAETVTLPPLIEESAI